MEKAGTKAYESIAGLLANSKTLSDDEFDNVDDERAVQSNTRLCSDLLHAITEIQNSASMEDDSENPFARDIGSHKRKNRLGNRKKDQFIRTSIQDYNNKSVSKINSSISIRDVIGSSITSKDLASLVTILAAFFTHRVQSLPATQDEVANIDVMDNNVVTLSNLSILSARVYTELIGMHGAFGMGLIDVGALSGLAALVRRWGLECSNQVKSMGKKKGRRQKRKVELQEDDMDSSDGWGSDDLEPRNVNQSKNQSIEGGLKLSRSLSKALGGAEFRNWNCDAREAIIESCVSAVSFTAALLATDKEQCTFRSLCQNVVDNISDSIRSCVITYVTDVDLNVANARRDRQEELRDECLDDTVEVQNSRLAFSAQRETVVYVLRSLYPVLAHQIDLPNEARGKEAAYKTAASLIWSMTSTISRLVENGTLTNYATTSSRFTPQRVHRASLSRTPLSRVNPNTSTKKTPRSLKKKFQNDDFPTVRPSLKNSATPKRSCRRSSIGSRRLCQDPCTHSTNQSQNILGVFVGMMQKISTVKGLERAEVRIRISSFLKECLRSLPNYERIRFIEFTTQICQSKMSSHRLFGVELIGEILLMEFIWEVSEESYEKSQSGGLRASNNSISTTITQASNGVIEGRHCSISNLMLDALSRRISDRAQAIRARAAHALSKILKSINLDEGTLCPEAERCLIRSISRVRPALISSLRTRAGFDSKASVRKSAIAAYIELFLLEGCDGIENDTIRLTSANVSILSQMCNDSSMSVRKTAAEAIVALIHKQHQFQGPFVDSGLLESAFADFVLPLVLDVEASCVEKVASLFSKVVVDPLLVAVAEEEEDWSYLRKKTTYFSSWKVLARFGDCTSVGTSKGSRRALRVVLDKVLNTACSAKQNTPALLLSEIFHVIKKGSSCTMDCTSFTETYPGQGDDAVLQIGAWCLLEALADLSSAQFTKSSGSAHLNLERDVQKSTLDVEFICSSWEALFKLSNERESDIRGKGVIIAISRSCLCVVSRLAAFMETSSAEELSISLEKNLVSFELCPDLIGASIMALIATTKRVHSHSSRQQFIEASAGWIDRIFKECERALDNFITTDLEACDKEKFSAIERVLFTAGEMCLIGFTANESHDRKKCQSLVSEIGQEREDDNPLCGVYVKPPDHLVYLVQAILPPTLPSISGSDQKVMKPTSDLIRAHAFTTLGKVCIRNEAMAKDCINFFARELRRSSNGNAAAQSNALIVLGDLCVRYANLVDKFLPLMASCLQSQTYHESEPKLSEPTSGMTDSKSSIVKQHAVLILANLLIQDYIKWRGDLFHRFLMASVDQDYSVANLAKLALTGPLLSKQPSLFFSNFVDLVFVLNGCTAHPMRAKFNVASKLGSKNLIFPRIESKKKRLEMYLMLLGQMRDEEKIGITARLVQEILGETLHITGALSLNCSGHSKTISSIGKHNKEGPPLSSGVENAYHVVADCLTILMDPNLRIGKTSKKEDETEEDMDTSISMNGPTASRLSLVKGRLLSKISRKHMIETAIPTLSSLKIVLEKNRSPLLKDLMRVMVTIYRQFKNEVSEILATNPTLLQELQYENRNYKKNEENVAEKGDEIGVASPEIWNEMECMGSVGSRSHSKGQCSLSK